MQSKNGNMNTTVIAQRLISNYARQMGELKAKTILTPQPYHLKVREGSGPLSQYGQ